MRWRRSAVRPVACPWAGALSSRVAVVDETLAAPPAVETGHGSPARPCSRRPRPRASRPCSRGSARPAATSPPTPTSGRSSSDDGFLVWNNFWYAGRYSFVTYSVLYYPLAALVGIKLLAVATIGAAALRVRARAGARVGPRRALVEPDVRRRVGRRSMLSGAFPFVLGAALALFALLAIQARRRWTFVALAVLTLAASPRRVPAARARAGGIAIARGARRRRPARPARSRWAPPGALEFVLWRVFPSSGHFPFSTAEFAAACVFCGIGLAMTWTRRAGARSCAPCSPCTSRRSSCCSSCPRRSARTSCGCAISRSRCACSRCRCAAGGRCRCASARSRWPSAWNVSPLIGSYTRRAAATAPAQRRPSGRRRSRSCTRTSRRRTAWRRWTRPGHWGAVYLPGAGIPIARGWFRQDDFPQNAALYRPLGAKAYRRLAARSLGVRYVVLTRRAARLQRPPRGGAPAQRPLGARPRAARAAPDRVRRPAPAAARLRRPGRPGAGADGEQRRARTPPPRPLPARDPLLAVLGRRRRVPRSRATTG